MKVLPTLVLLLILSLTVHAQRTIVLPPGFLSATMILPNIPEGTFNGMHQQGSGPNRAWIRRVITPWEENEMTWRTQAAYSVCNQVQIPASVDVSVHAKLPAGESSSAQLLGPLGHVLRSWYVTGPTHWHLPLGDLHPVCTGCA